MSVLRVNQITNENGSGPIEFTRGATFASGSPTITQSVINMSATGVATITEIKLTDGLSVGILTATTFSGSAAGITNIPGGTLTGKAIGLHLITWGKKMPSQIRVDSITDLNGTGAVTLSYGASIPSGQLLNVQGNVNISGIATVGFLTAKNANVTGVITATSFVGSGSGLTNVPVVSSSKSIALAIIGG